MRTLILSRPDRIGDVIITTSCLAPIRGKFPGAKIYFVAAERMRPLLEGHPLLDGFIPLSAHLTAEFRRLEASAIVHFHPHRDCYLAAQRARIPARIGYPLGALNRRLTHAIRERRKQGLLHEAEYNFDLLQPLHVAAPSVLSPQVHLPEASRAALEKKLPWPLDTTRFAVVHPTAHSEAARWPLENFLRLADRLQEELGLPPVFVGADAGGAIPRGAAKHLNLAGRTDLAELGWLLRRARVLITNDSGPGHLAAAVGCPVVALFGRTAPLYGPARWRPLSDRAVVIARPLPQRRLERRESLWRRCFAAISVDEVMDAARRMMP